MVKKRMGIHRTVWIAFWVTWAILTGFGANGLAPGSKAPDFRLPLSSGSGEVGLSDFANKKIVIVHFWKSK